MIRRNSSIAQTRRCRRFFWGYAGHSSRNSWAVWRVYQFHILQPTDMHIHEVLECFLCQGFPLLSLVGRGLHLTFYNGALYKAAVRSHLFCLPLILFSDHSAKHRWRDISGNDVEEQCGRHYRLRPASQRGECEVKRKTCWILHTPPGQWQGHGHKLTLGTTRGKTEERERDSADQYEWT